MNDMFFPLFCNGYVAQLCGEKAAIIFHQIAYLIHNNQNDGTGFRDGKYWMTKTLDAWANYYPNINRDQVFRALRKLEEEGLIESANFNPDRFDRTRYYTITERGWSYATSFRKNSNIEIAKMQQNGPKPVAKMQYPARANKVLLPLYRVNITEGEPRARGNIQEVETQEQDNPIPPKQDNVYSMNHPKSEMEVIEEAEKRRCKITAAQAQEFIDHYEATADGGTWMLRNTPVRDWRRLITLRWLENWQRDSGAVRRRPDAPAGQTMEELAAEIAAERAARGIV